MVIRLEASFLFALCATLSFGCRGTRATEPNLPNREPVEKSEEKRGEAASVANFYEVNLRNYTKEGTFRAFEAHLPRLAAMGVDVVWLMPIHRISSERRTGSLGSPYSVGDYRSVNPEFGTFEDFRRLVDAIHDRGMRVVIDWVPNHTGWDHPWISEHPEYYTHDSEGRIIDPLDPETGRSWGWLDVADLDYGKRDLRRAMIDEMRFWVDSSKIDGFRVDVAHGVPREFWEECLRTLGARRPLVFLAEAEDPLLVEEGRFAADYAWEEIRLADRIAASFGERHIGERFADDAKSWPRATARDYSTLLARKLPVYSTGAQMRFTSNHDENSWQGTDRERLGAAQGAFFVLAATLPGIPLVYGGQEASLDERLPFFEKGEIRWGTFEREEFYRRLLVLRRKNPPLAEGPHGGGFVELESAEENVLLFVRYVRSERTLVVVNLSDGAVEPSLGYPLGSAREVAIDGDYRELFSGREAHIARGMRVPLEAWGYRVFVSRSSASGI